MTYKKPVILFTIICILFSCDNNNKDKEGADGKFNYIHSVIVGNNSFLSRFKDLSISETDNSNAYTLSKASFIYSYGPMAIVCDFEKNQLIRYDKSGDNDLELKGKFDAPSNALVNSVSFLNANKAYVSYRDLGKVAVINPNTMKEIKQIDLSTYAVGDNDPNPEPAASIIRDGKLYVSLLQEKSAWNPHSGAYAAVIDVNTDKVIKMISDSRATSLSAAEPTGSPFIDENGDIYFYCNGVFGFSGDLDGFLRIKKGEDDFDKSYFFPLKNQSIPNVKGNKMSYIYQMAYYGNGDVYGFFNIPANSSNPPDYVNDKNFQPFKVNIYSKTIEKVNLPATTGWSSSIIVSGNTVIWGMVTNNGTGYFTYDHTRKEGSSSPKIRTSGSPYRLLKF